MNGLEMVGRFGHMIITLPEPMLMLFLGGGLLTLAAMGRRYQAVCADKAFLARAFRQGEF
ncbi:hypothetical protein [Desulfonema ishimotonii]|uniref:hypothetical protein n=1 Tax=Desulfonema ishimotonii TaxID=45657 RepID=UPI000F56E3C6|nr:hypothetical protein [Desulfonema ishimotonii]